MAASTTNLELLVSSRYAKLFRIVTICVLSPILPAIGCGKHPSDDNLGGLVHTPKQDIQLPKPDLVARDPVEFTRAMTLPHHVVSKLLGSHTLHGTSQVEVLHKEEIISELSDETRISFQSSTGNYHATLHNSKSYGREAIFVDGVLYLRPRYGKYHRRKPTSSQEPVKIRQEIFSTMSAYWELLAPAAQITDVGATPTSGRTTTKVSISHAQSPGKRLQETRPERSWRNTIEIKDISGEAMLDTSTGIPISASFRGTIAYTKEERSFRMRIHVTHQLTEIGADISVSSPEPAQTVTAYPPNTEHWERQTLLENIHQPSSNLGSNSKRSGRPDTTIPNRANR